MLQYPKPRIVISECLGINPVRYDGNIIFDQYVEALKRSVEVISVCPEVGLGSGVLCKPLVLNQDEGGVRLVDTFSGRDLINSMVEFATRFLKSLPEVDGFLLKASSPTCGIGDVKVYDRGRAVSRKVDGLFTTIVKNTFPYLPVESEKRLGNVEIRRVYYTKIFTLAYIRESLSKAVEPNDIVSLHLSIKYILMLHDPSALKKLGSLVADRGRFNFTELKKLYWDTALRALSKNPTRYSYLNVFQHVLRHLRDRINDDERMYVLSLLKEFSRGSLEVKTIVSYLKGFIFRFHDEYLAKQRFLQPYPEELD